MKFMLIWEFNIDDIEIILEKAREFQEEKEKYPEKYPKSLLPSPMRAGFWMLDKAGKVHKHFTLFEVENEEQMLNQSVFWSSLYKMKWVPILSRSYAVMPFVDLVKKRKLQESSN